MDLHELKDFAKKQNAWLARYYDVADITTREQVCLQMVKVNEELGEFADALLSHYKGQRAEKLSDHDPENVAEEFADVIITLFVLADRMNIDAQTALEKTIKKLEERHKK